MSRGHFTPVSNLPLWRPWSTIEPGENRGNIENLKFMSSIEHPMLEWVKKSPVPAFWPAYSPIGFWFRPKHIVHGLSLCFPNAFQIEHGHIKVGNTGELGELGYKVHLWHHKFWIQRGVDEQRICTSHHQMRFHHQLPNFPSSNGKRTNYAILTWGVYDAAVALGIWVPIWALGKACLSQHPLVVNSPNMLEHLGGQFEGNPFTVNILFGFQPIWCSWEFCNVKCVELFIRFVDILHIWYGDDSIVFGSYLNVHEIQISHIYLITWAVDSHMCPSF